MVLPQGLQTVSNDQACATQLQKAMGFLVCEAVSVRKIFITSSSPRATSGARGIK
jgi:hypothetical protein